MIVSTTEQQALLNTIRLIAADIGRLRRVTDPNTSAWWALERIASNVENLDNIVQPTAAEIYRDFFAVSGDEQVSVEEALRVTDARVCSLHELLAAPAPAALRAVA